MERIERLTGAFTRGELSRRQFIRRAIAVGGSLAAVDALLAACGGATTPTATPAPTGATTPQTAGQASPTTTGASAASTKAAPVSPATSATTAPSGSAVASSPQAGGTPQKGGQVIVGLSQEPTIFNPLMSTLEVDRGVQYALFDSLWRIDEKGQLIPNLATEIPSVQNGGISKDGLTYTFKLRKDVKWHDAQPFTAKDVLFSHKTVLDPKFNAGNRIGHDLVTAISAPDDATVTMTLKQTYAPFLIVWSDTYIVPEHILGTVPDLNTAEFNSTKPVGTGAFTFAERVAGDHITLQANPNYHGPGPYLDKVIFKYIPDLTVMFTQFKTGEIDYTGIQGITADHYNEAKGLQGKVINLGDSPFVEFIFMNFGKPQFQELPVRQALYAAMDKKNIIDKVYYGLPKPSETYLPLTSWALNPNLTPQVFNMDQAKKILDDAGWKPGGDGVREKNGVKLSFTNSTTAGNKVREQAQQYLQQTWKQIGVDMQIKNFPAAVIWGDYFNKSQYDTVMVGENAGLGADPDVTTRFGSAYIPVQGGGGQNTEQYKNPTVDKLLAQGATELDQEKRKAIYVQLQQVLRDDLAFLPIFHYANIEGTKAGLMNYKASAYVVSNVWNINEWWWQK
ncbi:MAG: peptide ABC transporter substrate-binding protein [Chloroflexota bacterium]|nr:peptide ABC transporter substrate-binding protein [Chloroflexota bacterium]